jgi:hypothetical protein
MEYIETEMKKRRGEQPNQDESVDKKDPFSQLDPYLYIKEKIEKEGSMTRSTAMLTQVQEVDLGIE